MAGHSKWSKVKRLKGALDAKRGALFSRLSKEITIAAKNGGGNPSTNHRLRAAIQSAKDQSMPGDNIERAIKKGTGELASEVVEEMVYEGYAPGGVAVIVEAATDNKNRTAAEIRSIFSKNGGSLGGPGSVAYLFHRKGRMQLDCSADKEDEIFEVILEAGADEIEHDGDTFTVTTPPDKLYAVAEALRQSGFEPSDVQLTHLAETQVAVTNEAAARQILRLCDAFEDCDDVLGVHANFEISDSLLADIQEDQTHKP
jgi:YebC/PmpR family DNA-binding regulatory protein